VFDLRQLGVKKSNAAKEPSQMAALIRNLEAPLFAGSDNGQSWISSNAKDKADFASGQYLPVTAFAAPMPVSSLGDNSFCKTYGTKAAFYAGAMANGIASKEMVTALGSAGYMGSFGSAGLALQTVEEAVKDLSARLPDKPWAINLIHSPNEPEMEKALVDMYLKYGVRTIEAAAFMALTPSVVRYRAAGLSSNPDGSICIANRIIAKISRRETAGRFLGPAPQKIVQSLLSQNLISEEQARLVLQIQMADDITVEADSGGHTDNRPLTVILPSILALRDELYSAGGYRVRVGAAGGIGTPQAAAAAFAMGADYIVTGSINHACVESGSSPQVKKLLAQADMADVIMAPAADMFEMGVKVQVLKRGTLFAMRAQKLYEIYNSCNCLEDIPFEERQKLEKLFFQKSLDQVWDETCAFFIKRDPAQLERAKDNPKRKMALVFRWYLGLSSRWANQGEQGREMDYQIWCGPAMGSFNAWAKGTALQEPSCRKVVDITDHILNGAAYTARAWSLCCQGVNLPFSARFYRP
jgi:PfaD family protein